MGNNITRNPGKKQKDKKRMLVDKRRQKLHLSAFGSLPDDIFMKIVLLVDYKSWNALRNLNGHFYHLMNPKKDSINKLWENKVRLDFPLTPQKLKCKRWDVYYNYKIQKIENDHEFQNRKLEDMEFFNVTYEPEWMIIEGCDYDINRINKTAQYNDSDLYKGQMDLKKNIPKGFDTLKLYCPVIALSNFKYLDYIDYQRYKCIVCKNTVHSVTTLKQARNKLAEGNCIRVVWTKGQSVFHLGGEEWTDPKMLASYARRSLKYEWEQESS